MIFNGTADFCIFIDYRGHHRNGGVEIYNAALQQKLWFRLTKNVFLNNYREFQGRKTLLIDIILAIKISVDLFIPAPYMLMLVLCKDALFHCFKFY